MPAKNSVKQFIADSLYHLYNRGVEKRIIFLDVQDYRVFRSYLSVYVRPKDINALQLVLQDPLVPWSEKDKTLKLLRLNNFCDDIQIVSYCLMPNHFHLLVKQRNENSIDLFMNSLGTRYTIYFNHKYKRIGTLYQGVYKGVLVNSDEQLLHVSRYIHRNPDPLLQGDALQTYEFSSYPDYLGLRKTSWVNSKIILDYFGKSGVDELTYHAFVENRDIDEQHINKIKIDEDENL